MSNRLLVICRWVVQCINMIILKDKQGTGQGMWHDLFGPTLELHKSNIIEKNDQCLLSLEDTLNL